jgi:hypothetical protein
MSDVSVTFHNALSLLAGTSTFAQVRDSEIALFKKDVGKLPATAQAFVNASIDSLQVGLSALVGAGQSAIGPFLAESVDAQATDVLNLLAKLGVPTGGALLQPAERAALQAVITGLKAGLDRVGIQIATNGTVTVAEKPAVLSQPGVAPVALPVLVNTAGAL